MSGKSCPLETMPLKMHFQIRLECKVSPLEVELSLFCGKMFVVNVSRLFNHYTNFTALFIRYSYSYMKCIPNILSDQTVILMVS